ncbi:phosphoadenosine phosphosulfate reductase domain-containing protein [Paenibacillus sp. MMO-177]|uniref:phosphoadenosine phosphosulfate reductase domain-containing protein n=1 Tax=Paenibacillus sp. MMO-177 TaxID=3081289 RepID=UPI003FA758CB
MYVLHHFIKDQPDEACIAADSGFRWEQIFRQDTEAGFLFTHLERVGFRLFIPEQAMIDALVDDDEDWHYQSPKHKFQMYAFHQDCSFLVEVYMQNQIPPYGANKDPLPYPDNRCQLMFDIDSEGSESTSNPKRMRIIEGETLDILDELDEELLTATRAGIKKIYDENSTIALLNSGGKDSRVVLQLMLEHAIQHPDPSKKIMVISADTLVENPGVKSIIHGLKDALAEALPWVEYHVVKPRVDNTLLVCIIGKGYQAPSTTFRYCVRRLKIEPARDFLESTFLSDGIVANEKTCLVMGSRDNESGNRKRSLQKYFGEDFYGQHPVGSIRTASPIRDWTSQEVVTYLAFNRAPWSRYGARNTELLAFYGSAAGSECPLGAAVINDNEAMMQCGKSARTGCYLCTISNDKSMGNLISTYPEYEKYYRFRSLLKAIGQDIRYGGIVGLQRIGKSKIGSGIGDLTIDARTQLLQSMVNLGIEWEREEIMTAYQMVMEREVTEGFPVTERFRSVMYQLLGLRHGFRGVFGHSVFDPYCTGVDQPTEEDARVIHRILEERAAAAVFESGYLF